jgi:hypothetical protein
MPVKLGTGEKYSLPKSAAGGMFKLRIRSSPPWLIPPSIWTEIFPFAVTLARPPVRISHAVSLFVEPRVGRTTVQSTAPGSSASSMLIVTLSSSAITRTCTCAKSSYFFGGGKKFSPTGTTYVGIAGATTAFAATGYTSHETARFGPGTSGHDARITATVRPAEKRRSPPS